MVRVRSGASKLQPQYGQAWFCNSCPMHIKRALMTSGANSCGGAKCCEDLCSGSLGWRSGWHGSLAPLLGGVHRRLRMGRSWLVPLHGLGMGLLVGGLNISSCAWKYRFSDSPFPFFILILFFLTVNH